jgi:hypothetical protein
MALFNEQGLAIYNERPAGEVIRYRTIHLEDPKAAIWNAVGKDLDDVEPMNQQILVAIYIQPATKTMGGLEIPQEAVDEDRFQGKVGMVLKKGPRAFVDADGVRFYGQNVEPGDWVAFRPSDSMKVTVGARECRLLPDVFIKMKLAQPDAVW